MARKFFFICCGIFLLALAYHLGAWSATAQEHSPAATSQSRATDEIVATDGSNHAVTVDGRIFCNPILHERDRPRWSYLCSIGPLNSCPVGIAARPQPAGEIIHVITANGNHYRVQVGRPSGLERDYSREPELIANVFEGPKRGSDQRRRGR